MKTNKEWIRITHCDNIPLREGRSVRVGDLDIAVFNLGDRFLAVDNGCPHNGGPLADGIVSGSTVICPLHAWKIDLECGSVKRPTETPACVRTYRTKVEGKMLLLEIPSADPENAKGSAQYSGVSVENQREATAQEIEF